MATTTTTLKASYAGRSRNWQGVIKQDGKVVWTCPHSHANRDQTSMRNGHCAIDCARLVVTLVGNPGYADAVRRSRSQLSFGGAAAASYYAEEAASLQRIQTCEALATALRDQLNTP